MHMMLPSLSLNQEPGHALHGGDLAVPLDPGMS